MEVPQVPLAQIAKLARQYYPSLPPAAKAFIDVEDLVQLGAIQWMDKSRRFDSRRASLTTFTHHIVRSYFLEIIRSYKRLKHPQGVAVPMDEIQLQASGCRLKDSGAKARVERLFQLASPSCREFLANYYFHGLLDFHRWNRAQEPVRQELEWLIERTGVSAEDFRACRLASVRGY